jgi:hypothetical protein
MENQDEPTLMEQEGFPIESSFYERMRSELANIMACADEIVGYIPSGSKSMPSTRQVKPFRLRTIDEFIKDEFTSSKGTQPKGSVSRPVTPRTFTPKRRPTSKDKLNADNLKRIPEQVYRPPLTNLIRVEERLSSARNPPKPSVSQTPGDTNPQPSRTITRQVARPNTKPQNKWIKIEDFNLPL